MAQHNDLGKKGELLAAEYLQKNGYIILEKNWFFQKAEIDILAQKENTLAVIEVKTRSSNYFGEPQSFVSKQKIKLLIKAVDAFVSNKKLDIDVRFDIIAITGLKNKEDFKIEHIENAFYMF